MSPAGDAVSLAAGDGGSRPATWKLDLSPSLFKRMEDRRFAEIDLRSMAEKAVGFRPDTVSGRWVIETRFRRRGWEVIVEPDSQAQVLIVITAYARG